MDRSTYGGLLSYPSTGWFSESSVNTPDFNKLKGSKQRLPINPYYWNRVDLVHPMVDSGYPPGTMINENHQRGVFTFTNIVTQGVIHSNGYNPAPVHSLSHARATVENAILSKVRNRDIDLGVAMGEYAQTAHFVSMAMKKVGKSYKQLRRGNLSGALSTLTGRKNNAWKDIPSVASDMWLAYSYALRPLVNDVYGAVKILAKPKPISPYIKVRTGKSFEVSGNASYLGVFFNSVNGSITCNAEITYYVDNPLVRELDLLGLTNPLSVAWELVPFSFVVDWFLPVGKYLSEVVPPQGVSFIEGWMSLKAKGGVSHRTDYPGNEWNGVPPNQTFLLSKEIIKERTRMTEFPRYNVIVPDLSLSKEKIASGLALLWSLRKGS